jgi:hypothetical protein
MLKKDCYAVAPYLFAQSSSRASCIAHSDLLKIIPELIFKANACFVTSMTTERFTIGDFTTTFPKKCLEVIPPMILSQKAGRKLPFRKLSRRYCCEHFNRHCDTKSHQQ